MRRRAGSGGVTLGGENQGEGDVSAGTLEIEFEDDEASSESGGTAMGRPRDFRSATMIALAVVVLGAALSATHHTRSNDKNSAGQLILSVVAPDYAAYMVTVRYEGSHLISLQRRRIAVDMRITPVPGAQISVLSYYVNENGVISYVQQDLSGKPLPASGTDVELELGVTDCAVVPIGESMGFVNVVADGPAGITDRFTILGERYAADLTRLLRTVCPGRASGQNPMTNPGHPTGP